MIEERKRIEFSTWETVELDNVYAISLIHALEDFIRIYGDDVKIRIMTECFEDKSSFHVLISRMETDEEMEARLTGEKIPIKKMSEKEYLYYSDEKESENNS